MKLNLSWAAGVALVVAVFAAGILNPVRPATIGADALGPDNGELVADYLDRAQASIASTADPDVPRWALVSFTEPVDLRTAAALAEGRVAQVLFRVPIDRVQTPLVTVEVSAHPESLARAYAVAAGRLRPQAVGDDRSARVAGVSADRLAAGCACVVGIVVRATLPQLRNVAGAAGVRAVDALPADAVAGRFSVTPLLPEQVETVTPGPDDGEP